jgi:hypothetical protein
MGFGSWSARWDPRLRVLDPGVHAETQGSCALGPWAVLLCPWALARATPLNHSKQCPALVGRHHPARVPLPLPARRRRPTSRSLHKPRTRGTALTSRHTPHIGEPWCRGCGSMCGSACGGMCARTPLRLPAAVTHAPRLIRPPRIAAKRPASRATASGCGTVRRPAHRAAAAPRSETPC